MATSAHPCFTVPDDPNASVWRYLDFTKFVDMLERRQLFFARADKLGDPFEGSTSPLNVQYWEAFDAQWRAKLPEDLRSNAKGVRSPEFVNFNKRVIRWTYISTTSPETFPCAVRCVPWVAHGRDRSAVGSGV